MIFLQETKFTGSSSDLEYLLNLDSFYSVISYPAEGLSGGLAIIWNNDGLSLEGSVMDRYWIGSLFKIKSRGVSKVFRVVNIYGPHKLSRKFKV